jgi:flagellar L-ring protein precursor FlgH
MSKWVMGGRKRPLTSEFAAVTAGLLLLLLAVSLSAQDSATLAPSPWAASRTGAVASSTDTPAAPSPVATTGSSAAGTTKGKSAQPPKGNVAQTSLASYLQRVKADTKDTKPTDGAIWTESGRLARFSTDMRAMRPHDLIQVVVQESLASETDGSVANSRASSASSQLTALLGALKSSNALQNLLGQSSASALTAAGKSANNSSLTTTFGGQVLDVLPNGTLVIEAARQVEFSQQTQTIVLRGLVRPEDISQQNQVLSTAISSLELEVKGKGIVNDSTYRQNPLVRLIERILVF